MAMSQIPQPTFLTANEVEVLCAPLKTRDARRRFLKSQGIHFLVDASGNPIVPREWLLMRSTTPQNRPAVLDVDALRAYFLERKRPARRR